MHEVFAVEFQLDVFRLWVLFAFDMGMNCLGVFMVFESGIEKLFKGFAADFWGFGW